MRHIQTGAHTVDNGRDIVLFLTGVRINTLWKVHRWWPVIRAFQYSIAELEAKPDTGFLGYERWWGRTVVFVQYWESFDQLEAFARNVDAAHVRSWRLFHKLARNQDVGVWHETYCVPAGHYESTYTHMPVFGLGKVAERRPVDAERKTARDRLSLDRRP
jgi:hypothetical protein